MRVLAYHATRQRFGVAVIEQLLLVTTLGSRHDPKIRADLAKGDWTTIAAIIDQWLVDEDHSSSNASGDGDRCFGGRQDHATMVDESVRYLRAWCVGSVLTLWFQKRA
jgi:hypothetical protein